MAEKESLYSVFMELNSLKGKIAAIEQQKREVKKAQFVSKIDNKLEEFSGLLTKMNEYLDNINNKKTTISLKMPEKSITNKNCLQLAHTHHDDFKNITLSKTKIEKLIEECRNSDKNTNLKFVMNQLKDVNSEWRTQFFQQLCEYKSTKGLLDNLEHLKEIDYSNEQNMSTSNNTDSDLGCESLNLVASSPVL